MRRASVLGCWSGTRVLEDLRLSRGRVLVLPALGMLCLLKPSQIPGKSGMSVTWLTLEEEATGFKLLALRADGIGLLTVCSTDSSILDPEPVVSCMAISTSVNVAAAIFLAYFRFRLFVNYLSII